MSEVPKRCTSSGVAVFGGGLLMGTTSAITLKVAYQMGFEKPLFSTFLMFLAMALSMPIFIIYQKFFSEEHLKVNWGDLSLLIAPTIFDLGGTLLGGIGLLYVNISIFQLVKCTIIVITALLRYSMLGEHLLRHEWLGVIINLTAMILVSSTTFFDTEDQGNITYEGEAPKRDPRLGILFIVLSCAVQGAQYVYEEKLMNGDAKIPPMVVVGGEGIWGCVMILTVMLFANHIKGQDHGAWENTKDSLEQINGSISLQLVLVIFFLTVTGYNILAVYVTNLLSSIWHAILDNFRPVSVWGTDLLLYYGFTNGRYGEAWTSVSWLQLAGMCLLFFGTAVYNGSISCLVSDDTYEKVDDAEGPPNTNTHDHELPSIKHTNSPFKQKMIHSASNTPSRPRKSTTPSFSDVEDGVNLNRNQRSKSIGYGSMHISRGMN